MEATRIADPIEGLAKHLREFTKQIVDRERAFPNHAHKIKEKDIDLARELENKYLLVEKADQPGWFVITQSFWAMFIRRSK